MAVHLDGVEKHDHREDSMHCRGLIGAIMAAAVMAPIGAQAADDAKYPDWKGAWARFVVRGLGGQPSFDQTKPWGFGQQAPLTEEYKKVLEASLADQAKGGQGNFAGHALCLPAGMPLMMIAFRPLEFIVTPETTYILIGGSDHYRRIFTDGRDWPKDAEATFSGYSIGKWVDQDGDGRYDLLEVETRGPFKGPRAYDASGLPLAFDNEFRLQGAHLPRQGRSENPARPDHGDRPCPDAALDGGQEIFARADFASRMGRVLLHREQRVIAIGKDNYYMSGDGMLMPARKDQPPPDLRYFKQSQK